MPTPSEKIKSQIENLHKKEKQLLQQLDKVRANKRFPCSCGKWHKIKECVVVQTHWYERPHGCTSGDYWVEGELQIVCPATKVRNRPLFDNYDRPYEERHKFETNPEAQFKQMYKHLFAKVIEEAHNAPKDYKFYNNDYFDKNRKKFELCLKYKEIKNER